MRKKIDLLTMRAEIELDEVYQAALAEGLYEKRVMMKRLRGILDGDTPPPRWCVTQQQKDRWMEKQLLKIIKDEKLESVLVKQGIVAGEKAEDVIRTMTRSIYKTVYDGTLEALRKGEYGKKSKLVRQNHIR